MHRRRNQIHNSVLKCPISKRHCVFVSPFKSKPAYAGLLICFGVQRLSFSFKRLNETSFPWCFSQPLNFALCIQHSAFLEVVGQNGLEPSTSRLSVVCSSQLSYWPISLLLLVESTGIEPVTSCLQGRRSPSWANPPCRRNQIHNARFQAAA